jgi:hypothetical protein
MNSKSSFYNYQLRFKGYLDERWLNLYDGLSIIQNAQGETSLTGEMDQSALYGILNRLRDLGVELILVQRQPSADETG